jgi:hypothetical protein
VGNQAVPPVDKRGYGPGIVQQLGVLEGGVNEREIR